MLSLEVESPMHLELAWQEERSDTGVSKILYIIISGCIVTHARQNYMKQKCHKQLTC